MSIAQGSTKGVTTTPAPTTAEPNRKRCQLRSPRRPHLLTSIGVLVADWRPAAPGGCGARSTRDQLSRASGVEAGREALAAVQSLLHPGDDRRREECAPSSGLLVADAAIDRGGRAQRELTQCAAV